MKDCEIMDIMLSILYNHSLGINLMELDKEILRLVSSEYLKGKDIDRLLELMKYKGHIEFMSSSLRLTEEGYKFYNNGKESYCKKEVTLVDNSTNFNNSGSIVNSTIGNGAGHISGEINLKSPHIKTDVNNAPITIPHPKPTKNVLGNVIAVCGVIATIIGLVIMYFGCHK